MPAIRGFTLLELLVVMFLMGLAISTITLSINGNSTRRDVTRYAEWFARESNMVLEEAEAEGRHRGAAIYLTQDQRWRWQWYQRREGQWQLASEQGVPPAFLPGASSPTLKVEGKVLELAARSGKPEQHQPDIVMFSSGEITPFEFTLNYPDAENSEVIVICADAAGAFQVVIPDQSVAAPCGAS